MSRPYATKLLGPRFSSFLTSGLLSVIISVLVSLVFPQNICAVDITLAWNANTEPDLDGYKIFYRQEGDSYNYNHPDWVGSHTEISCTIYELDNNTTYYFVARAVDEEGNESGDSNEVCYQPEVALTEVIVDNGGTDTSWTGTWNPSSGEYYYGTQSVFNRRPSGGTYAFEADVNGCHEVSLWWTYWQSRCTSLPVEIYDVNTDSDTPLATFHVNQQTNGGQWNVLDTFDFTGTARVVIISEGDTCSTCADAVRFVSAAGPGADLDHIEIEGSLSVSENSTADYTCRAYYTDGTNKLVSADSWDIDCPAYAEISASGVLITYAVDSDQPWQISASYTEDSITTTATYDITITDYTPPTEVIIDNRDLGSSSTGRWRVSSGSNPYGKESLYSMKVGATYTFQATIGGPHEVSLWWTYRKSRCATVPVEIYDGAMLLDIIPVNQKTDGGQWTVLGTYVFSDLARVRIVSEHRRCSTCADAVRFVENW